MSQTALVVIARDDQTGNLDVQTDLDAPNLVFLLEKVKAKVLAAQPALAVSSQEQLAALLNGRR